MFTFPLLSHCIGKTFRDVDWLPGRQHPCLSYLSCSPHLISERKEGKETQENSWTCCFSEHDISTFSFFLDLHSDWRDYFSNLPLPFFQILHSDGYLLFSCYCSNYPSNKHFQQFRSHNNSSHRISAVALNRLISCLKKTISSTLYIWNR